MTAENAQREPTMEEILASIRRIISEEDKPAEEGGDVLELTPPPAPAPVAEAKPAPVAAAAPAPAPAPKPAPAPAPEPVVAKAPPPPAPKFEEPPPAPVSALDDDLMVVEDEEPAPLPEPVPPPPVVAKAPPPAPALALEPRPVFAQQTETLVSAPVASATAGALGKLMGSMLVSSGNTLDDVVRELLKPMLKEWLDINLPSLVEAEVAKEIDRIRRLAR